MSNQYHRRASSSSSSSLPGLLDNDVLSQSMKNIQSNNRHRKRKAKAPQRPSNPYHGKAHYQEAKPIASTNSREYFLEQTPIAHGTLRDEVKSFTGYILSSESRKFPKTFTMNPGWMVADLTDINDVEHTLRVYGNVPYCQSCVVYKVEVRQKYTLKNKEWRWTIISVQTEAPLFHPTPLKRFITTFGIPYAPCDKVKEEWITEIQKLWSKKAIRQNYLAEDWIKLLNNYSWGQAALKCLRQPGNTINNLYPNLTLAYDDENLFKSKFWAKLSDTFRYKLESNIKSSIESAYEHCFTDLLVEKYQNDPCFSSKKLDSRFSSERSLLEYMPELNVQGFTHLCREYKWNENNNYNEMLGCIIAYRQFKFELNKMHDCCLPIEDLDIKHHPFLQILCDQNILESKMIEVEVPVTPSNPNSDVCIKDNDNNNNNNNIPITLQVETKKLDKLLIDTDKDNTIHSSSSSSSSSSSCSSNSSSYSSKSSSLSSDPSKIKVQKQFLITSGWSRAKKNIGESLRRLNKNAASNFPTLRSTFKLSECSPLERQLIQQIMENPISCMVGPAGSGKTQLIKLLHDAFGNMVASAFTCLAVQNIKKRIPRCESDTMHSVMMNMVHKKQGHFSGAPSQETRTAAITTEEEEENEEKLDEKEEEENYEENNNYNQKLKKKGFKKNRKNKQKETMYDLIALDEGSMISEILAGRFFKNVPTRRLLIVGDSNQIPPFGSCKGNLLYEFLAHYPVLYLEKIYRQNNEDSLILSNAMKVLNKDIHLKFDRDTFFIRPIEIGKQLLFEQYAPERFKPLQFVTATNRQAEELNQDCVTRLRKDANVKTIYNKTRWPEGRRILSSFAPGERIMFTNKIRRIKDDPQDDSRNANYYNFTGQSNFNTRELFVNGEQAIIEKLEHIKTGTNSNNDLELGCCIRGEEGSWQIKIVLTCGRVVTLFDEFVHAYALTVNKIQGSEAPVVALYTHSLNPNNTLKFFGCNHLYTAITRAKQIFCYLGNLIELRTILLNQPRACHCYLRLWLPKLLKIKWQEK